MAEDETDLQLDDLDNPDQDKTGDDPSEDAENEADAPPDAAEDSGETNIADNGNKPPEKPKTDEDIKVDAEALIADLPEAHDLPKGGKDLEAVYDIPVQVSAVLGKSKMQVSELLKLGSGAVVELDRKVGEAIDIYVNNRLVARGEVVVVENRLGITMTEIIKTEK